MAAIADGDTITVLRERKRVEVRLLDKETPETAIGLNAATELKRSRTFRTLLTPSEWA